MEQDDMAILEEVRAAVVDGQAKVAVAKVDEALAAGIEAGTLLREGLIAGMAEVGQLYEEGEVFVPEMLVAARAMSAALAVLKPHLVAEGVPSNGRVAIGTTQGDLHDIGKNLVAMMLEGSGYEIVDLGVDVPAAKFIEAIRGGANVVAMSALLTTTMTNMQSTIEAIREAGLREQVRIIVGGAPITKSYADEIGADGYAEDASSAVRLVKEVLAA
jgi:5-methyltetrahydrofolate--homocysteine methyltransferase